MAVDGAGHIEGKVKIVGRQRRQKPLIAFDGDTGLPIGDKPSTTYAKELAGSEDSVLRNMRDLILHSKSEAAAMTACAKVLDALEDPETPQTMREKLEKIRYEALDRLKIIGSAGKVAAVRANANAYLIKAMRGTVTASWPDEKFNTPEGRERMQKAKQLSEPPRL